MKRLLLTTAILGASALAAPVGALAQDLFRGEASPDEVRASDLMGMRVYASEEAVDTAEGIGEGWEDIGEVNDLILGRDGSVEAVLVDIGGFLGIGERQTALSMSALRFVSDSATADDVGDYFLVVNASRASLEKAPDYASARIAESAQGTAAAVEETSEATSATGTVPTEEVAANEADGATTTVTTTDSAALTESETEAADTAAAAATGAAAGAAVVAGAADATAADADAGTTTTTTAQTEVAEDGSTVTTVTPSADAAASEATTETETATTDTAEATTTSTATDEALSGEAAGRAPISREGYVAASADVMTAEALQGAAVFDGNDDRVGEVGEILIDDAGQVTDMVVDVGGFLGIGEKAVALPMSSLDVLQQEGGDDLRVYVSQTEEELEALEPYAAE